MNNSRALPIPGCRPFQIRRLETLGGKRIRNGPIWNGLADQGIRADQLLAVLGMSLDLFGF